MFYRVFIVDFYIFLTAIPFDYPSPINKNYFWTSDFFLNFFFFMYIFII